MTNKKPKDINEYKKWLKEKHKIEISDKTQKNYDSVTNRIKIDFEKSDFWNKLTDNLREYDGDYLAKTGYNLLTHGFEPVLHEKSFESFLLKTFRINIIENKCWPDEPKDGWILPNNWFSRINDIVRTLFEVKYLDGVEFMINKVKSICEEYKMGCKVSLEATEVGYYAAHLYIKEKIEIPKVTWDTEWINVSIEIQITTQIQEVIRKLLHKYYEDARKRLEKEDIKWQWNYKNPEFATNYLGHILHYVEGMIMEIREKQKEEII